MNRDKIIACNLLSYKMKTIKAEILMIEGAPFPVIKEIYDPSNERRNGNITPEAPIVITGQNLDMLTWESTNLYLVSSVNDRMLIECEDIHKYSDDKIYMTVPDINEGEYFLALMILMKDKESFYTSFPYLWWYSLLNRNGTTDIRMIKITANNIIDK